MSFAASIPQGPTIPPSGNFSDMNIGMGLLNMNDCDIVDVGTITVNNELIIGSANNLEWKQGPKLIGSGDTLSEQNGYSVTISGDFALVSAIFTNDQVGSVFVYQNVSGKWTQISQLIPDDNIGGSVFGTSVSLLIINETNQYAAIGGSSDNSDIGAAWIFRNTGSGWEQVTKIIPDDNIGDSSFGVSISLVKNGNLYTAIIGGYTDNSNKGAAWIYQSTGGTSWSKITKIIPTDNVGNPLFGKSVSLVVNGTSVTAVIGGPQDNSAFGAAWIYQSTNSGSSGWTKITKIIPTDQITNPSFGCSVSLTFTTSGYDALIGGNTDDSSNNIGAAWIYNSLTGSSSWAKVVKLVPTDDINGAYFGISVCINGIYAIVGGYRDDSTVGAAWIYQKSGTDWVQIIKLVPDNVAGSISYFGWSVAITSTNAIIGGITDDAVVGTGAAWIYSYSDDIVTIEDGNITTNGTITASILSDGYGSYINGGNIISNTFSDGAGSYIQGGSMISNNFTVLDYDGVSSSNFATVDTTLRYGTITINNVTLTNGVVDSLTMTNSFLTEDTLIMFTVLSCAATTNNFSVNVATIASGTCDITVCNIGPDVADISIKLVYMIIN